MHYGVDPKIKCLSVIMCQRDYVSESEKMSRNSLMYIVSYPQLIRSIFWYVIDPHQASVIHYYCFSHGLRFHFSMIPCKIRILKFNNDSNLLNVNMSQN